MKETIELAQWVIDNRYPKSPKEKTTLKTEKDIYIMRLKVDTNDADFKYHKIEVKSEDIPHIKSVCKSLTKLKNMNKDNKNTELDNTDKKLHISDVVYSELRKKFFYLIAGSFAHHEDDYPDVEIAADDAIELVKEFIQKLK